jgi:ACS family hexuronate transporter-like MFS transporter
MNFIKNEWPIFKARKTSMLIYALCAIPVFTAQLLGAYSIWFPILIIGFGAAAHQAWSANIYTTVSDMFPKKAVASVTGIAGMAGGVGGIIVSKAAGYLFDHYKSLHNIERGYFLVFIFCSIAYIAAWLIIHFLVPKMKKVEI